jgi:hypothetical protein
MIIRCQTKGIVIEYLNTIPSGVFPIVQFRKLQQDKEENIKKIKDKITSLQKELDVLTQ